MRQLSYILLILIAFSCAKEEASLESREIYYRGISGLHSKRINGIDTIYYRTEIIVFYSDSVGLKILDERDSTHINEIVSGLPRYYKEPDVFSNIVTEKKLHRIFTDSNTAIISELVPGSYSLKFLQKTFYDRSVEKLFTRKYQVECQDTVYLTDLSNKWLATYSTLPNHKTANNQRYSKNPRNSGLTSTLAPKHIISYDALLREFATYTTTPLDTTGSHQFDNNEFAIVFRTIGTIGEANYSHHIAVIDDSLFCRFDVKFKDSIKHKTIRPLTFTEKQTIRKLFITADLNAKPPYLLPIPTKAYQALPVLVVGKYKNKNFAGGFLNPYSYPYCLLKTKTSDEVYRDCRELTATVIGHFDELYRHLESKYTELDSLQRLVGLK